MIRGIHVTHSADEQRSTHAVDSLSAIVDLSFSHGQGSSPANARIADEFLRRHRGSKWVNYADEAKARAWVARPAADIVDAVERIRSRIEQAVEAPTRKRRKLDRNRDEGFELDPQAVLERRTDGWTDTTSVRAPKSVVRVGVNLSVNCHRDRSELLFRGATLVAVADILSAMGHSVEVLAIANASNFSSRERVQLTVITVKPADAPLDMSALCAACCEIGFFRYAVLPAKARLAHGTTTQYFGQARGLDGAEVAELKLDVVIDAGVFDEESAIEAALGVIRSREVYNADR